MQRSRTLIIGSVATVTTALLFTTSGPTPHATALACASYYVATGDGVPYGQDDKNDGNQDLSIAYPQKLLDNFLNKSGQGSMNLGYWCLKNLAQDKTTTSTYVNGTNQQAVAAMYKPILVTVQVGRWNSSIVDHVTTCFDEIKHHDFITANACALGVLLNQPAFDQLAKDLSGILGKYQTMMGNNSKMIVAVPGYFNPFPHALTVMSKVPGFCAQLVDTIPTCIARWVMLPPALVTLDQVVKKLNSTIQPVVQRFTTGNQGRFIWVDTYKEMNDHCMTMKVTIHTKVYHPPSTTDQHDTQETNFGCDTTWIGTDGKDVNPGFEPFTYLPPAVDGVLIYADHTTKSMGINPNDSGHTCIATLIWAAIYQKLGYAPSSKPATDCSKV
ncbi:MAG TPA: hypothetical protein VFH66_02290 [Mycobacteriales bacterium]|nr:hypothetical protein [Mycobacteriales bacterium]